MQFIRWIYSEIFHCCRRVDNFLFSPEKKDVNAVAVTDIPWLWIGGVYKNGTIIDYTSDINRTIAYGTIVNPAWLNYIFNAKGVEWRYLDAKTLEEGEIPSSGFVIHDPLNPESEVSLNE